LPFSIHEIEILETISLTEIKVNFKGIIITLLDKMVYEKEINSLKSRTKIHPNYLLPKEIEVIVS
jgi:hypothetical protein